MGTLNCSYIRASEPPIAVAVRSAYPAAFTEVGSPFFAVKYNSFRCPKDDLQSLSGRLNTDVIWLSFQSTVDAFEYHRWASGAHMRSLVFGCIAAERTWDLAEGRPEEWESEVLFGPAELAKALRYRESEQATSEIERVFRERSITAGSGQPNLNARETARAVAKFYGFPGWS